MNGPTVSRIPAEASRPDVTFVLPGLIASGGVRAVLEISDQLLDMGLSTEVVVPERSLWAPRRTPAGMLQRLLPPGPSAWVERIAPRKPGSQDWFPLRTPLRVAPPPLRAHIGDARVVVATSWRTAEEVLRSAGAGERGLYFLQHHEIWSGPERRVHATWRAFERLIVSSEWLRTIARERYGKRDVGLAVYGVDRRTFAPAARGSNVTPVVGFMWDPREWKGGADVLAALERVRAERPLVVRAFGLGDVDGLPDWIEFAGRLTGTSLADFYRGLDLFVSGSWTETGPMTLPEAMACGTPVVTTEVGNVGIWSGEHRALRIVEPHDREGLAAAVSELLADDAERARMSSAGLAAIAPFTWRLTAEDFLSAVRAFGLLRDESAGGTP